MTFLGVQLHAVLPGCNAQAAFPTRRLMNIARMLDGECEHVRIALLKLPIMQESAAAEFVLDLDSRCQDQGCCLPLESSFARESGSLW
jgi:hypothetical protein